MRKQKWIINVLLLAVAATLVVKLRGDWLRANQRYSTIKLVKASAPSAPAASAPATAGIANPAMDMIVQNNVFQQDRNNTVAPLPQKNTQAPPEPILLGAMDLGAGPLALMAEGGDRPGPAHQVKVGEMIGGYKLTKVAGNYAMVEWEGQEKRLEVQFAPVRVSAPAQVAQERAAAQPVVVGPNSPPPNVVNNVKPTVQNPSGNSTGDKNTRTSFDMFGPGVQDTYPAGTVKDGWKKVEHPWPFGGKQVWWEKVNQ